MARQLLARLLFASLFAFVLVACDSSDPEEPAPDPPAAPPSFSVSSQTITLQDNSDGIIFFVSPSEDVVLVRVEITNPRQQNLTFNAGSSTVVRNESFALQDAGIGYVRFSGDWTFEFVGRRAAGDQESFNVTVTVNVGA
ncbi:MAG: hypothetical protein AAF089_11470 [Bacteroidota bacterium]